MTTLASSGPPPSGEPAGEDAASLPAPPPATTATTTTATTHPFFMKTSEKKKVLEQKQQREHPRAPTPNPTSASDNEEHLPQPEPPSKPKPKRTRKKVTKPRKGSRPAPPKEEVRPSSSPINLASMHTEIDPMTAAAAPLTPGSSISEEDAGAGVVENGNGMVENTAEMKMDEDAEVDRKPRRSKRRKKTTPATVTIDAPKTTFRMIVDDETGMILSSSRASTPQRRGRLEVSRSETMLMIRASSEAASELLPVDTASMPPPSSPMFLPPLLPSSPVFPPLEEMDGAMSGFSTPRRGSLKIYANCNPDTITVVDSSPLLGDTSLTQRSMSPLMLPSSPVMLPSSPPQQLPVGLPPRRNAFALLGKKKALEKPPPARKKELPTLEDSPSIESKPAGKGRKLKSKKTDDKLASPKGPTTTIADSKPESMAVTSNRPAHPFFSAAGRMKMQQSAPPAAAEEDAKPAGTTATPPLQPSPGTLEKLREQQAGWVFSSTFGKPAADRVAKNPAIPDVPWPPRGTAHVRGFDASSCVEPAYTTAFSRGLKLKDSGIVVRAEEDILNNLASQMDLCTLREVVFSEDYQTLKYIDISPEVKVPNRILTTGSLLQEMVRLRVSARLPHPKVMLQAEEDSDCSEDITVGGTSVHPALFKLYQRLGTTLTAFDVHECESSPWEVKYAPETSCEILQLGREKEILRQWLIELRTDKVHVEKGGSGKGKRKGKPKAAAVKKKRKKKDDDMDGFMVTSEDEASIMDEITDPEADDWLNPTMKTKKSTVRSGDKMDELIGTGKDANKMTNAIVISGPTGSGKTAAVYAAAKELGYAVFEVNPGTRRSGKDVLDQVGDMSRNHLVHHAKCASETDNPFSKAKAATATPEDVVVGFEVEMQMRRKQSLILFEEVDILFDEDKSFWSTIIALMSKSKRPVVLTCNDESLLPWDDLCLHAILRFSIPPRDLLVDHLLLMAANEGHLLQRSAVEGLVQANRDDLRSSVMDLQFYCRMAVGDRKGGLDWMIGRYPIGCDIADNGEKLRVVSEDTYCPGMGMVHDTREEGKWLGVWEDYGLDVGASNEGIHGCANAMPTDQRADRLAALKISENFFDARSDADAFASLSSSHMDHPKLDFSLPKRSAKTRLDDLCGYSILQTEPHTVPGSVETEIAVYTRSLARSYLASEVHKMSLMLPPLSNSTITESITSRHEEDGVSRMQLQNLFSPLSKAEIMFASTPATTHSSIYPSLRTLATEVAPYVRSILRYDIAMEKERRKASNLLSLGGKRKTRAARLAVEGGDRRRKERWLHGLGADVVGRSAGEDWEAQPEEEDSEMQMELERV